jgi:hypothetical protein
MVFTRRASGIAIALLIASSANAQLSDLRAGIRRHVAPQAAPVLSAIVPGSGQFMQGKDRSIVYAAIEALAWWKFARDWNERSNQSDAFKDLARRVARARFTPNGPDGDWIYYEAMRDHKESGLYSKSDVTLVPETDPETFNGYTWQVIVGTTDIQHDMARALELYSERAAHPDMLWSWANAGFHWDLFKRSTEKRNDADAALKNDVTILAFNHLLSMVDAFAEFRLTTRRLPDGRTAVGASLPW